MQFDVTVFDGENREFVNLQAGPENRFVRTAMVVAFLMDKPFEITAGDSVIATGGRGDYIVLDNGIPRVESFKNFAPIHTPLPPVHDDVVMYARVAIERVIAKHVEFDDDLGPGELADMILGVIASIEVSP